MIPLYIDLKEIEQVDYQNSEEDYTEHNDTNQDNQQDDQQDNFQDEHDSINQSDNNGIQFIDDNMNTSNNKIEEKTKELVKEEPHFEEDNISSDDQKYPDINNQTEIPKADIQQELNKDMNDEPEQLHNYINIKQEQQNEYDYIESEGPEPVQNYLNLDDGGYQDQDEYSDSKDQNHNDPELPTDNRIEQDKDSQDYDEDFIEPENESNNGSIQDNKTKFGDNIIGIDSNQSHIVEEQKDCK